MDENVVFLSLEEVENIVNNHRSLAHECPCQFEDIPPQPECCLEQCFFFFALLALHQLSFRFTSHAAHEDAAECFNLNNVQQC